MEESIPALPPDQPQVTSAPDKKRLLILAGAILVVIIIFAAIFFFLIQGTQTTPQDQQTGQTGSEGSSQFPGESNKNITTPTPSTPINTGKRSTDIFFNTSPDYPNAYKIFPEPVDEKMRSEFARYATIKATPLSDGSTRVEFEEKAGELFSIPDFIARPGYSIYLVDTSYKSLGLIEDIGNDFFILVDDKGFIAAE